VPDPVSYTGVLPIGEATAVRLSQLLDVERRRRGTRRGRRALGPWRQAVLVLRWFLDATRVAQLAVDNQISPSTAYRYLHEGIDVLAAVAPGLQGALLAARTAGHTHVALDGTLVRTDRSTAAGPTAKVDLWWSGKHHHHGGNVQVVTAPDGWPLWVSDVRPGREHDVTCARTHPGLLDALVEWTDSEHVVLADLGYLGETDRLICPIKKPVKPATLGIAGRTVNMLHSATRAPAERGNSLLKTTFKALRRISLCPWRIGAITAAALVLLHTEHNRTT
jgi:DDE superfamily endonuclease